MDESVLKEDTDTYEDTFEDEPSSKETKKEPEALSPTKEDNKLKSSNSSPN